MPGIRGVPVLLKIGIARERTHRHPVPLSTVGDAVPAGVLRNKCRLTFV
jgi:hypothetical protein